MRRALSALGPGGMLRQRPDQDRGDTTGTMRLGDRLHPAHRRRFVQDGDVKVEHIRRDPGSDAGARPAPQTSGIAVRLQRVEAQLAAETAARQQAERVSSELQATIRDLRTKLGHAELARAEAAEILRRERENHAAQRAQEREQASRGQETEERVRTLQQAVRTAQSELNEERTARKALEKELRIAQDAREAAERMVRVLTEEDAAPSRVTSLAERRASRSAARRANANADDPGGAEPVKWWLNPPTAKRR